jgi:hypothetical protein
MAGECKKLYKQMHDEKLGTSPLDLQMLGTNASISPNNFTSYIKSHSINEETNGNTNRTSLYPQSSSYNGHDIVSRKTLFYLISTLNASFHPDYDFSSSLSSEFSKEPSYDFVIKDVDSYLATVDVYSHYKQKLWDTIDKEINLSECDIYR